MNRPYRWLLLDLNSYFASVEQQLHPELRGKPVAVVPMLADNTSVIAASYEAKKFGVKTGTRVGDAKRMCPGLLFRSGGHEHYVEMHQKIVAAIEKVLPVSAVLSIDEMACELMGSEQEEARALKLGREVKARILTDVGECLKSSVGLAPNRYLAKVASDMQKPDGLVGLKLEQLPHVLHQLKLRDLPGIGERMEIRLNRYGITTVEKLCSLPPEEMRAIWGGIQGERFHQAIRGIDYDHPETDTKTIGHSHVLPPEARNMESAYLILQKLLHKAAIRLRKNKFWCAEIYLSVRFLGRDEKYAASTRLVECCDDLTLLEALRPLWQAAPKGYAPLKVGIVLSRLVPDSSHHLSFFDNPRREKLAQALDAINARYGRNTLFFASMKKLDAGAAPTRIAFSNIPDFSA